MYLQRYFYKKNRKVFTFRFFYFHTNIATLPFLRGNGIGTTYLNRLLFRPCYKQGLPVTIRDTVPYNTTDLWCTQVIWTKIENWAKV